VAPRKNAFVVNAVAHPTFLFLREILGDDAFSRRLEAAGLKHLAGVDIPDNSNLLLRTEEYANVIAAMHHAADGSSLLREVGRRTFRHSIDSHWLYYGLSAFGKGLHMLPYNKASEIIVKSIVKVLVTSNPTVVAWSETVTRTGKPNAYIYQESTCAMCYGRTADEPVCVMYAGFIAEAMFWATNRRHSVVEIECMAKGDPACKFLVEVAE
jgi:predicted hydrocarbon binding protein